MPTHACGPAALSNQAYSESRGYNPQSLGTGKIGIGPGGDMTQGLVLLGAWGQLVALVGLLAHFLRRPGKP
jgi:hypothetical protein